MIFVYNPVHDFDSFIYHGKVSPVHIAKEPESFSFVALSILHPVSTQLSQKNWSQRENTVPESQYQRRYPSAVARGARSLQMPALAMTRLREVIPWSLIEFTAFAASVADLLLIFTMMSLLEGPLSREENFCEER